jgi:flagellar basal body-associated protein FliL
MLPMGANPFIKPTPTPTPDKASVIWIIILCIIVVLLAGFLGWAI